MSTYGVKYTRTYETIYGDTCRTDIELLDYSGSSTDFVGGLEPLTINWDKPSDDVLEPICGSHAELHIRFETDDQYQQFYTYNKIQWRVSQYFNGGLKWQGFILPAQYKAPYQAAPYMAKFTVVDGLGLLKKEDFVDTTGERFTGNSKQTLMWFIHKCLKKTGLELDLWESVNRYEDNQSSGNADSVFTQTYLMPDAFYERYKDYETISDAGLVRYGSPRTRGRMSVPVKVTVARDTDEPSCYEVLSEILTSFNACVKQVDGVWIIKDVEKDNDAYRRRKFTYSDGSYTYSSNELYDPVVQSTAAPPAVAFNSMVRLAQGSRDITPGYAKFNAIANHVPYKNLLDNADFSDWDSDDSPSDWDEQYSPTVSRGFNLKDRVNSVTIGEKWITHLVNTFPRIEQTIGDVESGSTIAIKVKVDYYAFVPDTTWSPDGKIGVMLSVGASQYYRANDGGEWVGSSSDPVFYVRNFDADDGNAFSGSIEFTAQNIPVSGVLKFGLSAIRCEDSDAFVVWYNPEVRVVGESGEFVEETVIEEEVDPDNFETTPDFEFNVVDPPVVGGSPRFAITDNVDLMYASGLYYYSGGYLPTSSWSHKGEADALTLVELAAQGISRMHTRAAETYHVKIYTNIIDANNVIEDIANNNKRFVINRATWYPKQGYWDVELIEHIQYTVTEVEESSGLALESASGRLLRESAGGGILIE